MTTAPLTDAPHTETTRVSAVSAATAGYSIDIASGLDGCTTVRLTGDFEMNSRAELTDVLGQALRIGTRVDVDGLMPPAGDNSPGVSAANARPDEVRSGARNTA